MEHVASVTRATIHIRRGRVSIQRSVVEIGNVLVVALVTGAKAKFTSTCGPRRVDWEGLKVIQVHHESQSNLFVIIQANRLPALLLRSRQCWQQHAG